MTVPKKKNYCKVNCQFMAETDHPLTAVQLTKSHKNLYPYPQKPVPLTRGTGFAGQGCGLPAPIPNNREKPGRIGGGIWDTCHCQVFLNPFRFSTCTCLIFVFPIYSTFRVCLRFAQNNSILSSVGIFCLHLRTLRCLPLPMRLVLPVRLSSRVYLLHLNLEIKIKKKKNGRTCTCHATAMAL